MLNIKIPKMKTKSFLSLILLILFLQVDAQKATWNLNTYPGPGHIHNPGPWDDGQGYSRTEKSYGFGMHPNNPDFMIYLTDIGGIAVCSDGYEFTNIDLFEDWSGVGVGFDPFDDSTAYINLNSSIPGTGGWYRTTDAGSTWSLMLERPTNEIMLRGNSATKWYLEHGRMVGQEDHIYVATRDGLMRSTDNGDNWESIGFEGQEILMIRMSRDGTKLYIIPRAPGKEYGSLWRIDDGDISTLKEVNTADITSIDVHPTEPDSGWVITNIVSLCSFSGGGTHISTPVITNGNRLNNVQINPYNGDHIVASGGGRLSEGTLYISIDGGLSFQSPTSEKNSGFYTWIKDYSPTNYNGPINDYYIDEDLSGSPGSRVFGFANDSTIKSYMMLGWIRGPYKSTDYGFHFEPFGFGGNSKPASTGSLAIYSEDTMAVGKAEGGLFLTSDGGLNWKEYNCYNHPDINCNGWGWTHRSGWGMAFHPENPNIVLAAFSDDPMDIYRTEDFGESWTKVGSVDLLPGASKEIFWSKSNPDIVYVSHMKSSNGGKSFTEMDFTLADISPTNGNLIIGYYWVGNGPIHYMLSKDAGETWTEVPVAPSAIYFGRDIAPRGDKNSGVVIDPRDIHDPTKGGKWRLLVGGRDGSGIYEFLASNESGSEGKWIKHDQGINQEATWVGKDLLTKKGNYRPCALDEVVFDPRPGYHNIVYAASSSQWQSGEGYYQQIYRSLDHGSTWHKIVGEGFPGIRDHLSASAVAVCPVTGEFHVVSKEGIFSVDVSAYDPSGDIIPPSTPENLSVTNSGKNIVELSWDASTDNTGVEGYIIYRDSVRVGATKYTMYTDGHIIAGNQNYEYAVRSYDAANNLSDTTNHVKTNTEPVIFEPAAHYKLDGSGTSVLDATPNNNNGWFVNLNDTNRRNNGVRENCILFHDVSGYIEAPAYVGASDELTISFWMKINSPVDAVLFDKMPQTGKAGWKILLEKDGTLIAQVGSIKDNQSIGGNEMCYELDQWNFYAVKFSSTNQNTEIIKNGHTWITDWESKVSYSVYSVNESETNLRIAGNRGVQIDEVKILHASSAEHANEYIFDLKENIAITADTVTGMPLAPGTYLFPETLTLDKSIIENLEVSKYDTIHASLLPSNSFNAHIQWQTENKEIVSIVESNDTMAVVYAKNSGETLLTAYSEEGGLSASCSITTINYSEVPIAWYRFENNAIDYAGAHHARLKNNPSFDNSDFREGGYALILSAPDTQWVDFTHDDFRSAMTQRSVSMWFKATSTTGSQTLYDEGGTDKGVGIRINNGNIEALAMQTFNTISTSIPFTSTDWTHLAMVYNRDSLKLFLNGRKVDEQLTTEWTQIDYHWDPMGVGASFWYDIFGQGGKDTVSHYFDGKLDDVRIFSGALDEEEIVKIYKEGGGLLNYFLTVSAENGSIIVDPAGGIYTEGSSVLLTANPEENFLFDTWQGDASGKNNPLRIIMNEDKSITANFILNNAILNLNHDEIHVYPNPVSKGKVNILFDVASGNKHLMLYDLNGRIVSATKSSNAEKVTLDVEQLKRGIYMLKIYSENTFHGSVKILIE